MTRTSHRRRAVFASIVLVSSLVASPVTLPGDRSATATNEAVVNTGLTGWPVRVPFGPPGAGVVGRIGGDGFTAMSQRMSDGSVFDLGSSEAPMFWMGTDSDPVLVGAVGERNIVDLNNDGDALDGLLVTSRAGRPFLPILGARITLGSLSGTTSCITRINAQLAVACASEADAGADANADGDTVDLELVLIRGDGSITRTGRFVDNTVGGNLDRTVTVLPDGSVSVGPLRVFPDGSVNDLDPLIDNAEVVATVGTSRLVRIPLAPAQTTYGLLPAGGTLIPLNGDLHLQVGGTVWLQVDRSLCRLTSTGTTGCMGVGTGLGWPLAVLGDDWAAFPGFDSDGPVFSWGTAYLVRPGRQPEFVSNLELRQSNVINATDLGASAGLLAIAVGGGLLWIGPADVVSPAAGAVVDTMVSLGDGRALVNLRERAGIDYNADGDVTDSVTHLFAAGALTNLGVTGHLDAQTPDRKRAITLGDGGSVLFAVDEARSGDRNGDGDTTDLVATLFDGASVVNLAVAVVPDGQPDRYERFVPTGTDTASLGVWEPGQRVDLDGNAVIDGVVTFAVTSTRAVAVPPFTPRTPTRVLDTRVDGPQVGYVGDRPTAGQTIEVTAPAGSRAIVLNVTGLNATQNGFVTVYPCGEPLPTASNLNLIPGLITPNLVIGKVGANGRVCIYTQRSADLIADLAGTVPLGSAYAPSSPTRVLDTRPDGPQVGFTGTKPSAGETIELAAPAGASAVVMNVTGLDADNDGFVTVFPCGGTTPLVSNLNLTRDLITPNLVISKVGANGKVCIYTQRSAHLIADLAGTFPIGSAYTPLSPARVLDTRADGPRVGYAGVGPVAGEIIEVTAPAGAGAVVMNVTGLGAQQEGFVTVFPCGTTVPTASNLNLAPGRVTPNLTITKAGDNGKVCIYTQRSAQLIADLAGSFAI